MSATAPCPSELTQVDVFVSGQEGYHTFRIPALARTLRGTLLAFCEGRKSSDSDEGDINLLLKRSRDHGHTWEPRQMVWDDGENTIGNPCPVVDRDTGVVWLPFSWNNDRAFLTSSSDDGQSWATPTEITEQVKPAHWNWYATGPGHGVQLSSGRLLIPCDHGEVGQFPDNIRSHVIFSDDHGATWRVGGILPYETDECTAVQTVDGRVCLNMRYRSPEHHRLIAWSDDGGETFSDPQPDPVLVEPVCQASTLRLSEDPSRVLFSNPASTERVNMTIRLSEDDCQTWPIARTLHTGPAAYSDLVLCADGAIGCLYECGEEHAYQRLTFARFAREWLTG